MAARKAGKRRLAYTVHVPIPEGMDSPDVADGHIVGQHAIFDAGKVLPDWAAALVEDHVYEPDSKDDGADDAPES